MTGLLAALTLVTGTVCFGAGFVRFASGLQADEMPPERHADGLVVLTGGADRVSDAVDLLLAGRADRMLITGVNPTTSSESLVRRLPRVRSLVDCCITLGYRALDTTGNAEETADWVRANHIRSLIVVTSNYHMPRALAEIGQVLHGVDLLAYSVVPDAAKTDPWWRSPHRLRLIAREYLKYLVVVVRQSLFAPRADGSGGVVADGTASSR